MTLSHDNELIIIISLIYFDNFEVNINFMHITVIRSAFVLTELRRVKWTVLNTIKRMRSHAFSEQNTRVVFKTFSDRHFKTYLSACFKFDFKFDCKSITFTFTPSFIFACQHCKHVAFFKIKHKMHLRRCFKQLKQSYNFHRRFELDRF